MWYLNLGVLRHVFGVRYAVSILSQDQGSETRILPVVPMYWHIRARDRMPCSERKHITGADPAFWSGGPSGVWTPRGSLSPKFAQNRAFPLKIAWKLHYFEDILRTRGPRPPGPPGSATASVGVGVGCWSTSVDGVSHAECRAHIQTLLNLTRHTGALNTCLLLVYIFKSKGRTEQQQFNLPVKPEGS